MLETQYHLLKTKRFLPLFITQFLNAFNDNVFKNALATLIIYKLTLSANRAQLLITLAEGIFILPFFLFSVTAGQLADKFEKSILIRIIKFIEIIFMLLGIFGFYLNSFPLLLSTLFLMGLHSAFFGPLKYAILPDHLTQKELVGGNALIEAATFIAILIGTILGTTLIVKSHGIGIIASISLLVACMGWTSSFFIPRSIINQPSLSFNYNFVKETSIIIKKAYQQRDVYISIIGISWFWFVGATLITQLPLFIKDTLHANANVLTLFSVFFTMGIAIGSLICNKLLSGKISSKLAPIGLLGMSLFIIDLYSAVHLQHYYINDTLMTIHQFLSSSENRRILFDVLFFSICSGIYVVPLYAMMQYHSKEEERARIVASNNILNAIFVVASAVLSMLLYAVHFTTADIFFTTALLNILMLFYIKQLKLKWMVINLPSSIKIIKRNVKKLF